MLIMKDGKVGPAHLKVASSPSYTLKEIEVLAREYVAEMENSENGQQDINLRLTISSILAWLKRREREVG